MGGRNRHARSIQEKISRILLESWDPLGVADSAPRDEYDSYVGGVYRLLASGGRPEELAEYLAQLERGPMGFADTNASRAMHTALRLCELDLRIDTTVTMDPGLEKIVAFLNRESIRATYGAVGEVLGVPGRSIGAMLGPRRPEGSWVVNTKSGEPTGYQPHEKHPKLLNSKLLTTGIELLRMMAGIRPHSGAR